MQNTYLTQKQFDELLEYSTSIPTGTTAGKQWKRHTFIFEKDGKEYSAGFVPQGMTAVRDYYLMGEYGEPDFDKKQVPITWRKIVIKNKETEIPDTKNALGL